MIDVIDGSHGKTTAIIKTSFTGKFSCLIFKRKSFSRAVKYLPREIKAVKQVTEGKANLAKGAGWAVAGGLLAGPLAAVAGGLLGASGRKVLYIVVFWDGRQVLCRSSAKEYETLLGVTLQRRTSL